VVRRGLAESARVDPAIPRNTGRMQHRANAPADTIHEYYKRNILIPLLDHLISKLESRFSDQAAKSVQPMNVLPIVLRTKGCTKLAEVMQIYIDDLPSLMTINAGIHAWEVLWKTKEECGLPESAAQTLKQTDKMLFPNIHTLLRILCTLQSHRANVRGPSVD